MNNNPVIYLRFPVLRAGVMVYEHWGGDLFDERLVSDIPLSDICVGIPVCLVSIDGCHIMYGLMSDHLVYISVRSLCMDVWLIFLCGWVSGLPVSVHGE